MRNQEASYNAIFLLRFQKIENLARLGIVLCAFLVIVYCLWGLDRGFDISDEAYYLLLAMHADSVTLYISAQQWITRGLWQLTGSLAMFRGSGLLVLLVSSAILASGVFSLCLRFNLVENRFESKTVLISGSMVCAMLYTSTINLSPSYNLLASAGAYAAAGMLLLATTRSSIICKYTLYLLAGCAVGVEALSKPPSGVATLVLLVFWVSVFERLRTDKLFGSLTIAFGAFIFSTVILLANTTIADAVQAVEQGMQLFRMVQAEPIGDRLARYFTEFWASFFATMIAFIFPIGAVIVYVLTRKVSLLVFGLMSLVMTLLFGSLDAGAPTISIKNITFDSYFFGGFRRYDLQITALLAMLLMGLIVSAPFWRKNRGVFALFLGLILLPYSVAIGTGNALFTQVIDSLAPWGAVVSVLAVAHYSDDFNKIPTSIIGACFIVTIALQIVTSSLRPYHLSSILTKQDQTTRVGKLGAVKVDAGTYKFLTEMRAAVEKCNITPGAPFIGLYNIPGVALALQAVPVLTPWLNNRAQAEFVMERVCSEELHSLVVALQMKENGDAPRLPQQLEALLFGYRYCGMATYPDTHQYPYMQQRIQIWQSQGRHFDTNKHSRQ